MAPLAALAHQDVSVVASALEDDAGAGDGLRPPAGTGTEPGFCRPVEGGRGVAAPMGVRAALSLGVGTWLCTCSLGEATLSLHDSVTSVPPFPCGPALRCRRQGAASAVAC